MLSRRTDPFKANHPFAAGRKRGAETAIRPPACRDTLPGPGKGTAPLGGIRKGGTFPPPARRLCKDPDCPHNGRPAPGPAGAKRPPVRALASGIGPRLVKDQRGAVAGAMAPANETVPVLSPLRTGPGNAARFLLPCETVPRKPEGPGTAEGQRPNRRARSARWWWVGRWQGAGRALAGGFGPRLVLMPALWCGRGDGPCQESQGARRRKCLPLCGQAAPATGTSSEPCQVLPGAPCRTAAAVPFTGAGARRAAISLSSPPRPAAPPQSASARRPRR